MPSSQSDQQFRVPKPDNSLHWYAVRSFFNYCPQQLLKAAEYGYQTYYAMRTVESMESGSLVHSEIPLIKGLFFIRCTSSQIDSFRKENSQHLMVYVDKKTHKPDPIRDVDMDMFILITSANNNQADLECLEPQPQYTQGDRVRVTQGVYKGAEGIVKRIRKDRKLLVAISGVAVVAISNIPMCYLEKIQQA